jgi:L-amino acid N-acyltransferase YncA
VSGAALDIRPAAPVDWPAIWRFFAPVVAAGETYALPRDMGSEDARAFWCAPDHHVFVASRDGALLGTYYLACNRPGGGAHVANCGYVTAAEASGQGVARAMAEDSLHRAKTLGFRAMQFNFVVSSNTRAVRLWHALGFLTVGRVPGAFMHPTLGEVDALVMHRLL